MKLFTIILSVFLMNTSHAYKVSKTVIKEERTTITFDFADDKQSLITDEFKVDQLKSKQLSCDQRANFIRDTILRREGLSLGEVNFRSPCVWSIEKDPLSNDSVWSVQSQGIITYSKKLP